MNVSLTISAGWIFTGRNGNSSQARLPVLPSTPKGVSSRRMNATPTRNIHFQYFTSSPTSIWDTTRYSTTPMSRDAVCTSI